MSHDNVQKSSVTTRSRIALIDYGRGVAVLLMIATHAVDAFLVESAREGTLWNALHISFGFVAPAFLLYSGLTFGIALKSRRSKERSIFDLFLRGAFIVWLGYWLQIPSHSLQRILRSSNPDWLSQLWDANILQVIGLTMIFLLAVTYVFRSDKSAKIIALLFALAIVIGTPLIWSGEMSGEIARIFGSYISRESSFPIVPYGAYFLVGFVLSPIAVRAFGEGRGFFASITVGALCIVTSYAVDALLRSIPPYNQFWEGTPQLFLFRVGGVVVATSVVSVFDKVLPGKLLGWLAKMGKYSLAVYILHLLFIYGSPINFGIVGWNDAQLYRSFTPIETVLLGMLVTIVVSLCVLGWQRYIGRYPTRKNRILWSFWLLFAIMFLTLP